MSDYCVHTRVRVCVCARARARAHARLCVHVYVYRRVCVNACTLKSFEYSV